MFFDFPDRFCFPLRQFFAIRRTTPTLALETLGVGSVRCGMRLRRTRRRTTGGGQGCYHDVDDFDLVDNVVVVVVLQNQFASGMWRTQRCAPGRSKWPPCQGTDSSRLRGCRLCHSDVVDEVVFVVIVVFGDEECS